MRLSFAGVFCTAVFWFCGQAVSGVEVVSSSASSITAKPVDRHRDWSMPLHKAVHVWEDVFPQAELNKLSLEARKLSDWAMDGDGLLQGKRATCWMLAQEPLATRSTLSGSANANGHSGSVALSETPLIEEYVQVLAQHAARAHSSTGSVDWLGYEYWVQRVKPETEPSFHYDKDEAMSSLNRKFTFPDVSSIFYLTWVHKLAVACASPNPKLRLQRVLADAVKAVFFQLNRV